MGSLPWALRFGRLPASQHRTQFSGGRLVSRSHSEPGRCLELGTALWVTGHCMGNGELSKMGCFESDLQAFRMRQATRGRLLSGRLDVRSARLGESVSMTWEKSEYTARKNRAERGGENCRMSHSFSVPDRQPCPQGVLFFLGFFEPLPTLRYSV